MRPFIPLLAFGLVATAVSASDSVVTIPGAIRSESAKTDLALFNPMATPDAVEVTLFCPGRVPKIHEILLEPGEFRDIVDVVGTLFNDRGFGNLEVRSSAPIMLNARRHSAEGERFLAPASSEQEIGSGDFAELAIHAPNDVSGGSVTISETAGNDAHAGLQILNREGNVVHSEAIDVRGYATVEVGLDLSLGREQTVRVSMPRAGGSAMLSVRGVLLTGEEATVVYPIVNAASRRRRAAGHYGSLNGKAILRMAMAVPQPDRAEFLQHRADLQANGFQLAVDGSSVILPDAVPAGWRVVIGNQRTEIRNDGSFTIHQTPDLASQGEILDPVDPLPLATFSPTQLSQPIIVQLPFTGVCSMNTGDHLNPNCHDAASGKLGPVVPEDITYPPAHREDTCANIDGFVSSDTSPLLSYFGSICNKRVIAGCCPNEGGWLIFSSTICCVKNHRGRFCQELSPGEVAVLSPAINYVDLGETVQVTIHNNGCFGDTSFDQDKDDIGGSLDGAGFDGATLQHYDEQKLLAFDCSKGSASQAWQIWIGDRTLTYTAPKCLDLYTGDMEDEWTFSADGQSVTVNFQLQTDNLYEFISTGQVISTRNAAADGWHIAQPDVGCNSIHVHGNHPCTGKADPDPHGCGQGKVTKIE